MIIEGLDDRLIVHAPAKVNLHLEVLGKRPDGYHEIESLMLAVSLWDRLSIRRIETGTQLSCDQPDLPTGADNLVCQAVELLRQSSGRTDGVALELQKRIPIAAGLAGGSSNAAATLAGLNRFWDLGYSPERLRELASRLGSDVPFFFQLPAAIARGRGEQLTPCRVGRPLHLVLLSPEEGLSTRAVYQAVRPPKTPARIAPIVEALARGAPDRVASRLFNRLEAAAARLSPKVAELRLQARHWDCLGALMSGSGSTFFALCASADKAHALARQLETTPGGRIFVVRSIDG